MSKLEQAAEVNATDNITATDNTALQTDANVDNKTALTNPQDPNALGKDEAAKNEMNPNEQALPPVDPNLNGKDKNGVEPNQPADKDTKSIRMIRKPMIQRLTTRKPMIQKRAIRKPMTRRPIPRSKNCKFRKKAYKKAKWIS